MPNGSSWSEWALLTASDEAPLDYFGTAVAIDVNTVIVGAVGDDHAGSSNAGSAYIFTRSGSSWVQEAKLTASDPATDDFFGNAVALDGDTAVVGSQWDDHGSPVTSTGSVYVFTRSGTTWTQQSKITPSDPEIGDLFGGVVSIDGDTIIIGAREDDHAAGVNAGSAYIFTRTGTMWTQQAKLVAGDAAANDQFGQDVCLDGHTALVGAWSDDHEGGVNAGSAYVFTRSGTTWTQQAKLVAADPALNDEFGWSVSVEGSTALVGASWDDAGANNAGAAYIFTRSGTTWSQHAKITASDPGASDYFGWDVCLNGNMAIVGAQEDDHGNGADAGSAYLFGGVPLRPPCPADIAPAAEGDGTVNVSDLLAVIAQWGACGKECAADIAPPPDGDGVVNVADLLAVIQAWGACP